MKSKINVFLCTSLLLSFVVLGACQTCCGAANSVELKVVADPVGDSDDTDSDEDDEGYNDDEDDDSDDLDLDYDDEGYADDEYSVISLTPTTQTTPVKPTIQEEVSDDAVDEELDDEDVIE